MRNIKYFIHYIFGKHEWKLRAILYRGNDSVGHTEECYHYECIKCHRVKKVKVNR